MNGPGSALFSPLRLRDLALRNRLVRSATAERMCRDDGSPDERVIAIARRLARGGVALIVTGHAYVLASGKCHAEMLGCDDDALIAPLAALAQAAHAEGARIALQMNHGGRACDPAVAGALVAPSAVALPGRPEPRALTLDEIRAIADAFGRAAVRARRAGFDAVQIHAAHGYLASQFLSPLANRRTDDYGGALENRARFLHDVIAALRRAAGADVPLLVKLGVGDYEEGGLTIAEGAAVAGWLEHWGVDAIEVSAGMKGAMRTRVTSPAREAYLLPAALEVRARSRLPLALVGGLRSRPVMERALAAGLDLVSLSRPLIREPDLPRRLAADPLAASTCIACNRCWPREAGQGIACRREA